MKELTVENVINVINETLEGINLIPEQIDDNLSDKGVDSIKFIMIIVSLEKEFDCEFPDEKLLITEMDSTRKIYDILKSIYLR